MNITESLQAETRALVDLFVAAPINGVVTFSEMSRVIGRPIGLRRHLVPRAMRIASRESGAIFGNVRGEGYKRLAAEDAHLLGSTARRRIRRTAKRASEAIVAAVMVNNSISSEAKRKAYAEVNTMGLIRHIATDRAVAKANEIADDSKPEPVAIVAQRFAREIGLLP